MTTPDVLAMRSQWQREHNRIARMAFGHPDDLKVLTASIPWVVWTKGNALLTTMGTTPNAFGCDWCADESVERGTLRFE